MIKSVSFKVVAGVLKFSSCSSFSSSGIQTIPYLLISLLL